MRSLAILFLTLSAAAGCAAHARAVGHDLACPPPASRQLPPGTRADGLTGRFGLTLVATAGSQAGHTVDGRLVLQPQDSALRTLPAPQGGERPDVRMPSFGAATIDLAAVGATGAGDIEALDPARPGVALLERHVVSAGDTTLTEIILRLGSEANRRDVVRFDGAFTALYVQRIAVDGFGGRWASGVFGRDAEGYFCAVRTGGGAPEP